MKDVFRVEVVGNFDEERRRDEPIPLVSLGN